MRSQIRATTKAPRYGRIQEVGPSGPIIERTSSTILLFLVFTFNTQDQNQAPRYDRIQESVRSPGRATTKHAESKSSSALRQNTRSCTFGPNNREDVVDDSAFSGFYFQHAESKSGAALPQNPGIREITEPRYDQTRRIKIKLRATTE